MPTIEIRDKDGAVLATEEIPDGALPLIDAAQTLGDFVDALRARVLEAEVQRERDIHIAAQQAAETAKREEFKDIWPEKAADVADPIAEPAEAEEGATP